MQCALFNDFGTLCFNKINKSIKSKYIKFQVFFFLKLQSLTSCSNWPQTPRLKLSFYIRLPSSWDYGCGPPLHQFFKSSFCPSMRNNNKKYVVHLYSLVLYMLSKYCYSFLQTVIYKVILNILSWCLKTQIFSQLKPHYLCPFFASCTNPRTQAAFSILHPAPKPSYVCLKEFYYWPV
jgi:hypothetical protein